MHNDTDIDSTTQFGEMQLVKRRFFAMRNGVIADTLRKAGLPFRIIFGLNLPQLVEVASMFTPSRDLAEKLWANNTTRESMLLAPMLMPRNQFSFDDAMRWVGQIPAVETADMLCFKLLRHLEFAGELALRLAGEAEWMKQYTALRLAVNIVGQHGDVALEVAHKVMCANPHDKTFAMLSSQIRESVM